MHENNDTNDMREYNNATDVTESILYTILVNDLTTVSTNMPSTIYNDSVSTTAYVEVPQDSENNQRLWNLSKTAITVLSEPTTISYNASRSTTIYTSTTESFDEFGPPEGVEYIFVPLGVVVFVIILSAVVWVAISLLSLSCDVFPLPLVFIFKHNATQVLTQCVSFYTYMFCYL